MNREHVIGILRRGRSTPSPKSGLTQLWGVFLYQFKIFISYRSWVGIETLNIFIMITVYYFMSFQVPPSRFKEFGYGDNYLPFALIGIAFTNYLYTGITQLGHSMRYEIHLGTFETVASSPLKLRAYVIGQALRGFIIGSYYMVGAIVVGVLVFSTQLTLNAQTVLTTAIIMILMALSHLGLGTAAAGFAIVYKQGDPITFFFSMVIYFFSAVLFPLRLLEPYPILNAIALVMPYTYSLDALRRSLIFGENLLTPPILFDVGVLILFTAVSIPLGVLIFRRGFKKVREMGATSSY